MLLQCSFKVLIELHRMFTVTNFRAELRAITLSTLIVHGDNGTPTPLEATGLRTANLIRASQLKIYAGAERVILNPAVDGLFYFAVKHEGRTWSNYGRFALIERPHKVEYTWMSEAAQGVESVVSVTFGFGYSTMFFLFAGFTVVYFITAAFFLPETKGKTLEEIEQHFEGAPTKS